MSRTITIQVDGSETTVRAINMFDMKLRKDLIDTVRATTLAIARDGRARAPVSKTPVSRGKVGDLKRSIRPKYFDGGLSSTVVPRKPKGSHRHLVEYGTKERKTTSGANRGKMPAIPFMKPAEQAHDSVYNSKIRSLVDRDETV